MILLSRPGLLHADRWEAAGRTNDLIVINNNAAGELVITVTGTVQRGRVRLKGRSLTDGHVRAIMLIEGWDTVTDLVCAGPGVRMSGTNGADDGNGYSLNIRRAGVTGGDPFTWQPRELTAGAGANYGTQSATVTGGLIATYSDLRIDIAQAGADANLTFSGRREGQSAAEYTDSTTDTTERSGTDVGFYLNNVPTTHTIRVKHFEAA